MTAQEFDFIWKRNFPRSIPLPHLFRQDYSAEWFRIRSLPAAKRYPTNDKEIKQLLDRQNGIITRVLGGKAPLLGITGEYLFDKEHHTSSCIKSRALQHFNFTELNPLNMYEISRSEFKPGDSYKLYMVELTWEPSRFNDLLEAIAYDEARMFFFSVEKRCLIAPFDGGVDFIITDPKELAALIAEYKDWQAKPMEHKV